MSASGSSAVGGHSSGGSSSSAGSNGSAGTSSTGGSNAAGGHANGGNTSVGGNGNAGNGDTGGSGNAGGMGGSNSAGAGGNAGTSSAGTSSGGAGGSSAGAGGSNTAGTGGGGGNPSCQDLMALAESQLAAARACDNSHNAMQCTGKVNTTCGCQVPVESNDSDETKAYLATLKRFQDKPCVIACTALACLPIQHAQCQSQGQSGGMCVAVTGPVTQ